ncbi:MAG: 50S ribosomal protein L23 [Candidatus Izemoplasmatales bacterium]|jgi:large subunit ribosomal protein L23|nr:50S ribosomal protein L23 [Dehalococcoidia bacterium]MDD3113016.1 50S ribosomal protein L23 [Candidatus Izemoplasmatales bacterium]NLF48440.1 50S ribosomal protein L23 [Acholeplasmataceae bacterium]MDD4354564.1 50S ribosomal protein L23 [Candidatus Izemoplasmatales bacterium]MDD4988044.1 50S ribosomal protein L23 [Candidatus Izemoplasmatales bacterium]
MDKYQVIKGPIISEKTTKAVEARKYTFEVDRNANKIEIKNAVEEIFKVKVTKVNVMNGIAKAKRVGKYSGFKPAVSKAVVTLAEGYKIDIYQA